MTANEESPPAACTLTESDHTARIAWIEELNRTALRGYVRDGSRMRLAYDPAAAARARELVRRERECCPFLGFATEEGHDAFVVVVQAPVELAATADTLFATYARGWER